MNWSSTLAIAGQAAPPATSAPAQTEQSSPFGMLPIIVIIMALFYFMVIRPQKRGQQQVEDMRSNVKKGDKVKTIGGIHGTVVAVDTTNNIVSVQVDRNLKLDFDRNAIATVTRKEDAKQAKESAKADNASKEDDNTEVEASK